MPNQTDKTIWPDESRGFCDFHENIGLIYGVPKIGKTSFGAQFPRALFMLTEDGAKHVKVRAWRIRTWTEFCKRVSDLKDNMGDCPFQNVIIDTADNLSDMCVEHVCSSLGVKDLTDADYGKGFAAYTRELKKQINALVKLGLGVWFISHAEEKTVKADSVTNPYAPAKARSDGMLEMTVPTLDKRARKFLLGLADIILYMAVDDDQQRVIHTKPTLSFEAGDRTGRLPNTIPLNYDAVVEAYYNNGDEHGRKELLERIGTAEAYLAQHSIDNFDDQSGKRKDNSRMNTLGTDKIKDKGIPIAKLEEYLQKLRMKAKAAKKNGNNKNGGKKK